VADTWRMIELEGHRAPDPEGALDLRREAVLLAALAAPREL
jgi:hypothetical protein